MADQNNNNEFLSKMVKLGTGLEDFIHGDMSKMQADSKKSFDFSPEASKKSRESSNSVDKNQLSKADMHKEIDKDIKKDVNKDVQQALGKENLPQLNNTKINSSSIARSPEKINPMVERQGGKNKESLLQNSGHEQQAQTVHAVSNGLSMDDNHNAEKQHTDDLQR